jgi:ethanolamine transporter EutH
MFIMKASTGVIAGLISTGVAALVGGLVLTKPGKKVRTEMATSIRNVADRLHETADNKEQQAQ